MQGVPDRPPEKAPLLGKLQAAAEAVFAQGRDIAADDLVPADQQVGLDPLGKLRIVLHRVGIPGDGFAAAPVKGQAQALLQGRICLLYTSDAADD